MHQTRISTTQVSSVMLKVEKVGNPKKGKTERAVGWTPECHKFESNPSKDRAMPEGDNPSFCDEFMKFTFFPWQFNSYSYFKASTKVLSNWAVDTLGD
jgi:hypothetical protein